MKNLTGKIALVTGASRGIGSAIAKRLAEEGALVAVHYGSNKDAANITVKEIVSAGGNAFAIQANLHSLDGVHKLIAQLDEDLHNRTGAAAFDILVNNAGIGTQGTIEDTTENIFDEIIDINLKAPFFLIQQAFPRLREKGRIINISSAEVRIGLTGSICYGLSKGALNTMTLPLAKHLGPRDITVNTIMPGYTKTDINIKLLDDLEIRKFATESSVFNRLGQVEDVADAAAFLASSDSRWITGQILDVSGGFRL
ncbi:SDR family oxidoreductase [Niallia circulans]|uniref:SDR family oxidoreductase n=1 Tax=Niallia circulans TaxID=1397 RepID=A0A553SLY2_NIACI|nr:SDR family oxidoreductase [Niallia circulans]TRZ38003.1 SDR family oxidoreductase [Niallia circulans]